ncbi:hypothetical protein [Embleya sp. NPDC005971]|uniref:hypothetical protein n=1 Tax=unclassified Embleya TaxID=2699296 RepID=UPI0033E151B8
MRIRVVGRAHAEPRRVVFTSGVGGGVGYWNVGDGFADRLPVVGACYDVEVDPPDDVAEWTRAPTGEPTGFSPVREGVAVTGRLEWVGRDGEPQVVMRLGPGIMTIDVAWGFEELSVGDVIRFEAPWLELWPYVV